MLPAFRHYDVDNPVTRLKWTWPCLVVGDVTGFQTLVFLSFVFFFFDVALRPTYHRVNFCSVFICCRTMFSGWNLVCGKRVVLGVVLQCGDIVVLRNSLLLFA